MDTAESASRALAPSAAGFAELRGVRVAYEVFGEADETLLLLAPWSIIHSRFWKLQVPYLARHFRVITFDGRGNGRSDRPDRVADYGAEVSAGDALGVLDATGTERCLLVAHCAAAGSALLLAANHPERVQGALFMSPALPISPPLPERTGLSFDEPLPVYEGWAKANRHYWDQDFLGYLEFFFGRCYPEPHSTK
jgi:pimeloyl-ACP methyl ester carboxylesterase